MNTVTLPSLTSKKTMQLSAPKARTRAPSVASVPGALSDQVRQRAYELFENRRRTGAPGDSTSDWLQAEREVNRSGGMGFTADEDPDIRVLSRGERLLASGE